MDVLDDTIITIMSPQKSVVHDILCGFVGGGWMDDDVCVYNRNTRERIDWFRFSKRASFRSPGCWVRRKNMYSIFSTQTRFPQSRTQRCGMMMMMMI